MEFVKDLGRKRNNIKISEEEKVTLAQYNSLLSEKEEIVNRYEATVERYNDLVERYNEITDSYLKLEEAKENQIKDLKKQKEEGKIAELKIIEVQSHIDSLLKSYEALQRENKKQKEIIERLEQYISIMDQTQKTPVKNERGAGRKKKYTEEHINKILELKGKEEDYSYIVEKMNREYPSRKWDIKEIKYVYTRYK